MKDILKNYRIKELTNFNVKESVFPFNKFDGVDLTWSEMKSTGEVMGIDQSFLSSYIKVKLLVEIFYHQKVMFLFQ